MYGITKAEARKLLLLNVRFDLAERDEEAEFVRCSATHPPKVLDLVKEFRPPDVWLRPEVTLLYQLQIFVLRLAGDFELSALVDHGDDFSARIEDEGRHCGGDAGRRDGLELSWIRAQGRGRGGRLRGLSLNRGIRGACALLDDVGQFVRQKSPALI